MKRIVWFKEIGKDDVGIVGGKGANLGEMYRAGFPIPPGFIVTAQCYKEFIERMGLQNKIMSALSGLNVDDNAKLQAASKEIQRLISSTPLPDDIRNDIVDYYSALSLDSKKSAGDIISDSEQPYVAVRSSATAEDLPEASFAGQQATFLNIRTEKMVPEAVQACWASLFTARAIYYRQKNNFEHGKVLIAVVVQKMVNSEKSGIMFTANPATSNTSEIVIEAVYGLGETIVSGSVNPNTFIVNKSNLAIKSTVVREQQWELIRGESRNGKDGKDSKNIQRNIEPERKKKQIIDDKVVVEIARIGRNIENHYKKPQDIEWAMEAGKVYIVQSRAITTLKKVVADAESPSSLSLSSTLSSSPSSPLQSSSSSALPSALSVAKAEQMSEQMSGQTSRQTSEQVVEPVDSSASLADRQSKAKIILSGQTASPGVASGPVNIIHSAEELDKIKQGDVLVTEMTNPDMVPAMKRASAIITDEGGMTCHAAIVSREMGIPCIVGTEQATKVLKIKQTVTVDATHGHVYNGKLDIADHSQTMQNQLSQTAAGAAGNTQTSQNAQFETITKVKVICDLPEIAERAAATGADGVGLLRMEFMIAEGGIHPAHYIRENKDENYIRLLMDGIGGIAKAFKDKPVWVRTSDMRSDEYRNLKGGDAEPHESDPMIGWHAIRRGLDEPRILKAEFTAIMRLHKEGFTNVGIMIPFVIRVDELNAAKKLMREVGLEPVKDIDFGVMVETPAACWIIEDLCKEGISFISFGTNDLTQLTLGIDRNNERLSKLFDETHPAVLGEIEKVLKITKKYNVQSSICGQAGSSPEMAKFLVTRGISSISANIDAVQAIRQMVAKTERELLLELARKVLNG